MKNAIETTALGRTYGKTEAVRNVTLAIPTGSVVGLLGPNGAGKTTLLKMLAGLQRPTTGSARILDRDCQKLQPADRQRVGYTSEEQRLPQWMRVGHFFDFCRELYPAWDVVLASRLADLFALPRERRLSQLSRGMRAKAALTASLAYRPELLLLDEPLSGIDIITREEIIAGVLELISADRGLTTVLSSHEIDDVERLADWIVILIGGELRLSEPLADLQARFRAVEVVGGAAGARAFSGTPPAWWQRPSRGAGVAALTHIAWNGEQSMGELRESFPAATITAEPMSLKEIYRVHAHRFASPEQGGSRS